MFMTKAFSSALAFLLIAAPVLAADLININTADSATLETLNGIGPSKAQAIIDYRTQHGPFAKTEDIMNVSGIGATTYSNIKDFITVGTPVETQSQSQTESTAQTQTQIQTQTQNSASSGGAPVPSLTVRIVANARTTAGAGSVLRGEAYGTEDELIESARYLWNFGDGTAAEGAAVFHTYAYPGKYMLVLTAASGMLSGSAKLLIEVSSAQVRLVAEGDGSLTLHNDAKEELSVGQWMLKRGGETFVLPPGMLIAAGGGVRFSPSLLGLPSGKEAELLYPNGSVAAHESLNPHAQGITYVPASQARASGTASPAASASASAADVPGEERMAGPVSELAAAGASGFPVSAWGSALGLLALITLGVSATLYGRLPVPSTGAEPFSPREETAAIAREFEIIDVTPVEDEDPSR